MYKHTLKVYDEDLYKGGTSGVVNMGGTMGALVVNVFATADKTSFAKTIVTIKSGDDKDTLNTTVGTFDIPAASNVKKGDLLATYTPPFDVETFLTASVAGTGTDGAGAETGIRITAGYLPR